MSEIVAIVLINFAVFAVGVILGATLYSYQDPVRRTAWWLVQDRGSRRAIIAADERATVRGQTWAATQEGETE